MLGAATLVATMATMGVAVTPAHAAQAEKRFCDVNWKLNAAFNAVPDEPTPAEIAKIEKKVNALLDDLEGVVPTEIEPQVTAASEALRQGLESAFQDPTLEEHGAAIDEWAAENCGYQTVDVQATEYHFEGIPKTLEPGRTVFRLTNEGAEVHEILVVRIKTDTPLKKLLADEKRAEKETVFAGVAFAPQGSTGSASVDLKAGRYAAVCFVPVGSVDPEAEVDGAPHAAEGMVQEFKVS